MITPSQSPDIHEASESFNSKTLGESFATMFQDSILKQPESVSKLIGTIHAKYAETDPFRDKFLTGMVTRRAEWLNDAFEDIKKVTSTQITRLQKEVGNKTYETMQA